LTFEGCPNRDGAIELVRRIVAESGIDVDLRLVDVPDLASAERTRFLGSPTIRVNGRDVEPGAEERRDYFHGCRIFHTEHGLRGQPDPGWLREALARATRPHAG
jgi:hypothetical protein